MKRMGEIREIERAIELYILVNRNPQFEHKRNEINTEINKLQDKYRRYTNHYYTPPQYL